VICNSRFRWVSFREHHKPHHREQQQHNQGRQDFLQGSAQYPHEKMAGFFLMISAGQDTKIVVVELKFLINL